MVQCRNCEKTFKTEEDFQKHNLSCSADKNTHKKKITTSTIKNLQDTVISQQNKINEQQNQIDYILNSMLEQQKQIDSMRSTILEQQKTIEILKSYNGAKNKPDILTILNQNKHLDEDFEQFIDNISLSENHNNIITKKGSIHFISEYLKEYQNNNNIIPIAAFNEVNCLYIYKNKEWVQILDDNIIFKHFISNIQRKITRLGINYASKNREYKASNDNSDDSDVYKAKKICSLVTSKISPTELYKKLYKTLKIDFKSIV